MLIFALCTGEFSLCHTNNGGCEDLCLLTSEGRVNCSCRGDRKLVEGNVCVGETMQIIMLILHCTLQTTFRNWSKCCLALYFQSIKQTAMYVLSLS